MKAIIDIAHAGQVFDAALTDLATGGNADYVLSFESAHTLFSDITPARLDLLDALARLGPCDLAAITKATGRREADVLTDSRRLLELGLIERGDDDRIQVPFETLEIRMTLAKVA
ncbi:MAG: transcriptional regulator [Chromatiaceae bacterium]|nr:transcriptional regulator [Chromatiaceae bacterium]